MQEICFRLGDTDNRILDIHRKLATIKDRLPKSCHSFLEGKSSSVYTKEMQEVINAFKAMHGLSQDGICDMDTWRKLCDVAGNTFTETWQFELDSLRERKVPEGPRPADEDQVIMTAHRTQLAGLAFSGGGIRSATFNLGMLQALAELEILRKFDYLSTVSGGGYIGGWFSKWLKREQGDIEKLERKLAAGTPAAPSRHEPEEVRFLRQYSNYLTPRTGLFSADTWSLLATYFRNTVLNLCIVAALLAAALVVPHLLAKLAEYGLGHAATFSWIAGATGLWSVFYIALSISTIPDPKRRGLLRGQVQRDILAFVVLPLLVSAYAGSIAVWNYRDAFARIWDGVPPDHHPLLTWVALPGGAYFLAWSAGWLLAQWHNRGKEVPKLNVRRAVAQGSAHLLYAVIGLAVGALLLCSIASTLSRNEAIAGSGAALHMKLASFGPPLVLIFFGIAMILTIGLVGRMYPDKSREWWSRQGGWTAICTLYWTGLCTISLYGAAAVGFVAANLPAWGQALVASAWFGTVIAGLLAGRSSATGKRGASRNLDRLAMLAPPLFSIGALLLVATLVFFVLMPAGYPLSWGASKEWDKTLSAYYGDVAHVDAIHALVVAALFGVVGVALSVRVDINKFSLYMMYRNRLVRAYLGASNRERRAHPFTGFDEKDEIPLDSLMESNGVVQRPLHIINTAMNLVAGKELAWQTRKAAAFSFSPAFCGFELPSMAPAGHGQVAHEAARGCYRPTKKYRHAAGARDSDESSVDLGMAVAVSGAAVDPNMGYHSSPALAFLMTLFNVRLGRWFANPLRAHWNDTSPLFGIGYLVRELFGMTDSDARYLRLSDGGHFENLGIYELVRRRCRLIVVVDAGQDKEFLFDDLGNAIRKCATDLQIEIDIDVGKIERRQSMAFSTAYCTVGKIRYDRADLGAPAGTLLYIKPSLLGTEYADLKNFAKANVDFPHQSTADQWFDETQFECYRSLGYRIGMSVFGDFPPPGTGGGGSSEEVSPAPASRTESGSDLNVGTARPETGARPSQAPQGPAPMHPTVALAQAMEAKWGAPPVPAGQPGPRQPVHVGA